LFDIVDNINGVKSVGSETFWNSLASEIKSRGLAKFTDAEVCLVVAALSKAGYYTKDLQKVRKIFKKIFNL
jgi:hypothetical protein